jgi:hypothetical protein
MMTVSVLHYRGGGERCHLKGLVDEIGDDVCQCRGSQSAGARCQVLTVLRDKPIRRTNSRTDITSRKCIRLILPTM